MNMRLKMFTGVDHLQFMIINSIIQSLMPSERIYDLMFIFEVYGPKQLGNPSISCNCLSVCFGIKDKIIDSHVNFVLDSQITEAFTGKIKAKICEYLKIPISQYKHFQP